MFTHYGCVCVCVSLLPFAMQVGVDKVCEWLQHVRLHCSRLHSHESTRVRLVCPSNTTEDGMIQTLSAQVRVVQAMRRGVGSQGAHVWIVLVGWHITEAVTEVLQELPYWASVLYEGCTWRATALCS